MAKKSRNNKWFHFGGKSKRGKAGKARGRKLSASVTQELDWQANGSASKVSRLFAIILFIHLAAVAILVVHALTKKEAPTPPSPLAKVRDQETKQGLSTRNAREAVGQQASLDEGRYQSTYRVVSGDSLNSIAQKLGVSQEALMRINNLHAGTAFYPGQKLYVPSTPQTSPEVVSGLLNREAISVRPSQGGQTFSTPKSLRVNPTSVQTRSRVAPSKARGIQNYQFQSGDTVYGISKQYGVSMDTLLKMNQISDPRKIQVGTVIKVPVR